MRLTLYPHTFTVEGSGTFPVEMLRYDACYPQTELAATRIMTPRSRRQVTLTAWSSRDWRPAEGMWESFGWSVVDYKEGV